MRVSWLADQHALRALRTRVFIEEQQVPPSLEWDDLVDAQCWHVLARDADGQPIGCGRLLPGGVIGRMAAEWGRHSWRRCCKRRVNAVMAS